MKDVISGQNSLYLPSPLYMFIAPGRLGKRFKYGAPSPAIFIFFLISIQTEKRKMTTSQPRRDRPKTIYCWETLGK
jgi:hypothetical protein